MKILPIAVSSSFSTDAYETGKKALLSRGYEWVGEAVCRNSRVSVDPNGTDAERLLELSEAFKQSEAEVLWAVRGGYGVTRILSLLPPKLNPKLVVGFSDTTALMLHLWATQRVKSLHATNIVRASREPEETFQALDLILKGQARRVSYPLFSSPFEKGGLRGISVPANLCLLTQLIGTSSMPDLSGSILLIEEVSEKAYQIDRMLTHLQAAGVLQGVKAVVVGHLTDCGTGSLEAFRERCEAFKIPCFTGFPIGHEPPNWPVPMGVQAEISVEGSRACLKILEELF